MLLVGIWWQENKNKLVEWNALNDTMGMKGANLEDKFLFQSQAAFWHLFLCKSYKDLTLIDQNIISNFYRQTNGIAISTKMGPSYANIFVGFMKYLFQSIPRPQTWTLWLLHW